MTRYGTIVADPPWHYEQFAPSQWKDREWRLPKPYPSMPAEDIRGLPIRSLAAPDCRLFLWTTNRYLPTAFDVLAAWGFRYRQLIVWKKTGNLLPLLAHIAPSHTEYLIVGTFGSPARLGGFPSNVVEAPKGASAGSHSRKPDVFLDLVEQVSPGPYLELFARRQRLGWDTWGNEALDHTNGALAHPRLLDLYCGAGGAARGYHDAGFDVIGIDIAAQPNYPYPFVRADALEYLSGLGGGYIPFDVIHASPPCQHYTHARHLGNRGRRDHPQLIAETRDALEAIGLPYVIENVEGAPLRSPLLLCGSMFGLSVRRHRLFETNWPIMAPACVHAYEGEARYPSTPRADGSRPLSSVVNPMAKEVSHEMLADGMGIDWMPPGGFRPTNELREAIPPAYTRFIGAELLRQLAVQATSPRGDPNGRSRVSAS